MATKRKKVKFASFSASIAAKGKAAVKIKLSKANQKLLKKLGKTPCKLTLKLTDGTGSKATAKQKITLVPRKTRAPGRRRSGRTRTYVL